MERLVASGRAVLDSGWPCFHTRLYRWRVGDAEGGVVGGTVGAPFAVLVAEALEVCAGALAAAVDFVRRTGAAGQGKQS